jgi:hypothetical protein
VRVDRDRDRDPGGVDQHVDGRSAASIDEGLVVLVGHRVGERDRRVSQTPRPVPRSGWALKAKITAISASGGPKREITRIGR